MELTETELKAKIKEAVDVATEEAVEGLKKKNTELLGKLKAAQKDSLISPEDHAQLQAELDDTQVNLSKAMKDAKVATKLADDAKKALEGESKVAHNLLVDNGLSAALLENGVKKASYLKAAKAMLAGQVVLTADGDKRIAKVGDKALAEFVKEWATSDEGKAFVDAPGNVGGGAFGGAGDKVGDGDLEKMAPEARLNKINETETEK